MAFNKNFVVKNGLQVSNDLLYASDVSNRVGINTSTPQYLLEVVGGIGATNLIVSGISTFNTILAGFTTFINNVHISSGNLNINEGLNVSGLATLGRGIVNNTLVVGGATTFSSSISVNGISTFTSFSTFQNDVLVSGVVTATSFFGNLTGTASTATNVSGGGIVDASTLQISGVSTFSNGPVFVGGGTSTGTADQELQVTGGSYISGNVGIGITNPTNKLSVVGDADITGVITATTFSGNLSGTAVTATNFYGTLTGNVTGNLTGTASTASTIDITASTSTDTTTYPLLVGNTTTGGQQVFIDNVDLSYNANTGALSATTFIGNLTGTASTASFAASATNADKATLSDDTVDTACFPVFANTATGNQSLRTNATRLTFNAVTGTLGATGFAGTFFANGTSNFASNIVQNFLISNYAEQLNTIGNTGTAATINLANGNFATATLTGNCTFTFTTGITTGASAFTLVLSQDAVGGRAVTWPVSVDWPKGTTPGITTTANATDIFVFFTPNNGTTWYGNITHSDIK